MKDIIGLKQFSRFLFIVLVMVLVGCGDTVVGEGVKLPDGSIYQGQMRHEVFHGQGELTYPTGARYNGNFTNGQFDGDGSFFYSNGDVYHGQFSQGTLTGKGRYTTSDGALYEGNFHKGKASGFISVDDKKNGYTYQGQMHDWRFSGDGEYSRESETYKGEFARGLYHGLGHLIYTDGGVYEGEFVEGQFHGNGVYQVEDLTYSGQFEDGEFQGYGILSKPNGVIYEGEFKNWNLHGNGKFVDQDGNITSGVFEQGYANGNGSFSGVDGRHYKGDFRYGQFDGEGVLTFGDGSHYKGEFKYGEYDGQGELVTYKGEGIEKRELGQWRRGRLIYNDITKKNIAVQSEIALEQHQHLLEEAIDKVLPTQHDQRNLYFLGVAGDGTQSVFRRELMFVEEQLQKRFGIEGRKINLVNDHETADKFPMATARAFKQAVRSIANKMDVENDVLFVYLTSHGSKDHKLTLGHDSIKLPAMPASFINEVLQESEIKWKAVVVSACYAGGFIPELDDGTTLIMTAADSKSTSFGCSDDSEMTYFGKALFKEVLANNNKINFHEAFYKARDIILEWEDEEKLTPSNPKIKEQADVMEFLQEMLSN